jgi:ssDNA thymidine ADP-ribosyltransferase DarT-like protein
MPVPDRPQIYHITQVDNLAKIIADGVLWSDRERLDRGIDCSLVGMSKIKQRRLEEIVVDCHPSTRVGEYVPFYFCPRSVMLYILWRGNHPEVTYRGGQDSIIHLVADARRVIAWAEASGRQWAFKDRNAGTYYGEFHCAEASLDRIDWDAVANRDFRASAVQEAKQAEFLVYSSFPWTLFDHVGVHDAAMLTKVEAILAGAAHRPQVSVEPGWYY